MKLKSEYDRKIDPEDYRVKATPIQLGENKSYIEGFLESVGLDVTGFKDIKLITYEPADFRNPETDEYYSKNGCATYTRSTNTIALCPYGTIGDGFAILHEYIHSLLCSDSDIEEVVTILAEFLFAEYLINQQVLPYEQIYSQMISFRVADFEDCIEVLSPIIRTLQYKDGKDVDISAKEIDEGREGILNTLNGEEGYDYEIYEYLIGTLLAIELVLAQAEGKKVELKEIIQMAKDGRNRKLTNFYSVLIGKYGINPDNFVNSIERLHEYYYGYALCPTSDSPNSAGKMQY